MLPTPTNWSKPPPQYQQNNSRYVQASQEYCRRDSHLSETSGSSSDEAFGNTQVLPLQSNFLSRNPTTEVNYIEIARANTTTTEPDSREVEGNSAEEAHTSRKRKLNALCAQRYLRDIT
jgi:hypothetical protein